MQEVHDLLDSAQKRFHETRGESSPDRAAQFDSHLATLRMVVDHTQANLEREAADEEGGE